MTRDAYVRTVTMMGTFVTIQVIGPAANEPRPGDRQESVERAFEWFARIEACCTRFDPASELMRLTAHIGVAVPVSDTLFEAVQFAIAVAEESGGAFDPTVGHRMESRGFNREHRTGERVRTELPAGDSASYRDVHLDPKKQTVTLRCPLILDLGAVAKGLAIDMAARELRPFENYAIDAGGDLYLAGRNAEGAAWSVGIRHPRRDREVIEALRVSNRAVCTSGDYERQSPVERDGHHILDPRAGTSATLVASATVVAPTAMAADALATAAFVLGPVDGIRLLERQGVEGLLLSPSLERFATRGFGRE